MRCSLSLGWEDSLRCFFGFSYAHSHSFKEKYNLIDDWLTCLCNEDHTRYWTTLSAVLSLSHNKHNNYVDASSSAPSFEFVMDLRRYGPMHPIPLLGALQPMHNDNIMLCVKLSYFNHDSNSADCICRPELHNLFHFWFHLLAMPKLSNAFLTGTD